MVRCDFCKVNAFLVEQGVFRYLLPHKAPHDRDLVYFPYWRFKGMLFSCLTGGIRNRFLDASRQAVASPLFPASVGLRSQALKLRFVTPETKGWFIKPALSLDQAMESFIEGANRNLPRPIHHQAHVGESMSLIYSPFYVDGRIVDAVMNKPVSAPLDDTFDLAGFNGGPADWRIRLVPTLCPNCGWDLQGRRDALALHCHNCESIWQASKQGMSRVNVAHMPNSGSTDCIYLPFWRIRADVSGIDVNSYADLVKIANLPKVPQPGWEKRPCHFWAPAFKVQPRSFLRLIHHITLSQPRDQLVGRVPAGNMHPINLPVSEAIETLKLNLAGFIRPKRVVHERIAQIRVKARRYLLVFLPFEVRHHDLVQATFNIAVNRNQLALAGNL